MNGNFKVIALKDNRSSFIKFNKGDIIEFKDGVGTFRNGYCTRKYTHFGNFLDSNFDWKNGNYFRLIEEGENTMEDLRELIKPCYVVKFRDNILTMAYDTQGGINFNTETSGYINLKSLNDQLLYKENSSFDIMEIYGLYRYGGIDCSKISTEDRPLIWKREEKSPTQLKIEEIESTITQLTNQVNELKSK